MTQEELERITEHVERRLVADYVMNKRTSSLPKVDVKEMTNMVFMNLVIDSTCECLGFERDKITSNTREKPYVDIRKIIFKLARDYGNFSLTYDFIGGFFKGNANEPQKHCTVMHGIGQASNWIQNNPQFRKEYERAERHLKAIINQ